MRIWGWVLALAAIIAIAIIGSSLVERTSPPSPAAQLTSPASGQARYGRQPSRFGSAYHRHRHEFQRAAEYSQRARTERAVAFICFVLFVLVTVPKNTRGIRAFYRQLVSTAPLAAAGGDDDNRRARKVLFFFLLFLLYQIVQFPLTWGRDNTVQFTSDLVFQFVLMAGVIAAYAGLQRGLALQWKGDPESRRRLKDLLGAKVEGIPVRWRDMPRLAALMFIGGFMPALVVRLPVWLDALTA